MKKLFLSNRHEKMEYHIVSKQVCSRIYEDGFSGFATLEGENIRGACCNCQDKQCANYSAKELSTNHFEGFPKNPTQRVCPVQAISFDATGRAEINNDTCIMCGLCVYRCPFAAIQYSIKHNKCHVNTVLDSSYTIANELEQKAQARALTSLPKIVRFNKIPASFNDRYLENLKTAIKEFSDLSEIIVRNTLLNLDYICNTNVQGNVHFRIEFFAEKNQKFIIGESEISKNAQDTLSVIRRILDDVAVLVNRHGFPKNDIWPLAVLEVLPNKRTDYYEVMSDVCNVLDIQIYTITYHILFILHLLQIELSDEVISSFVVNKHNTSLLETMSSIIKDISIIDESVNTSYYMATK